MTPYNTFSFVQVVLNNCSKSFAIFFPLFQTRQTHFLRSEANLHTCSTISASAACVDFHLQCLAKKRKIETRFYANFPTHSPQFAFRDLTRCVVFTCKCAIWSGMISRMQWRVFGVWTCEFQLETEGKSGHRVRLAWKWQLCVFKRVL